MVRGEKTEKGWAAIDDFEFLQGDIDCSIVPSNADPTTTTTKLSLFKIRNYISPKTTTTTTFKPKSLADLVSFFLIW